MAYGFLSKICFSANRVIFYLGHGQFCSELPRRRWTMSSLLCYLEKSGHKFLSSLLCYLEKSGHKFFVLHDIWTLYNKIISKSVTWNDAGSDWVNTRVWFVKVICILFGSVIPKSDLFKAPSSGQKKFRQWTVLMTKNVSFMITNKSRNKLHYWFLSAI